VALSDIPVSQLKSGPKISRWGVILLCHGSQRGTSKEECSCAWVAEKGKSPAWCRNCPSTPQGLLDASQRLQIALGDAESQVLLSCLEFIPPHPDQAVRILADQGLRQLVIMPFLLGHGKHATEEMAEVLEDLRASLPQVRLELTDGLGADPRMADLVAERVHDLDGVAPAAAIGKGDVGVMLVKAGTKTKYDDCRWLQELGQMVERRLGKGYAVEVAQSHYGDPTMPVAAAKLVEERRVSAVIFVPYLFFPGLILQRNVLGGMKDLQEKYPEVDLHVTPPLGVDDRVVAVAADRVRASWHRASGGS
jgi:sirohydrochlorin ferrochelatase